jgi:glycosyltransferase involved in cell wall biosynthesis
MNVLFVSLQSVSMVHGGPHTQVLETARHLEPLGVRTTLFNPWASFRPEDYDLAHVFGANIGTFEIAQRLHQFGLRTVVSPIFFTRHGPGVIRTVRAMERAAGWFGRGIWSDYGLSARICGMAVLNLPNTAAEGRLVERGLGIPSDRIRVVPNGVDGRFLNADPEPFYRQYGVRDFILNVGHIGSHRKNVLNLIRAVRNLDLPTVIIGKIHRNAYSETCLREAASARHIRIIEGLPNDSDLLASAYAACRVFALPSFYETPGIAALEAGLAGARVVITPYGGTQEYFGDRVTYVDPRSVVSIRRGIELAANAPVPDDLKDRIAQEYLWPRIAEKTLAAYQSILTKAVA